MRDINRIDVFCRELSRVWKNRPDWRFTQLICNFFGEKWVQDPFYTEDDETLKRLIDFDKEN